MKLIVAVKNSQ